MLAPRLVDMSAASLSARRAWIEIAVQELIPLTDPVALRKESVDRNLNSLQKSVQNLRSLSARRAWIEIPVGATQHYNDLSLSARRAWIEIITHRRISCCNSVALRKESVDRNRNRPADTRNGTCRSPQGERG